MAFTPLPHLLISLLCSVHLMALEKFRKERKEKEEKRLEEICYLEEFN